MFFVLGLIVPGPSTGHTPDMDSWHGTPGSALSLSWRAVPIIRHEGHSAKGLSFLTHVIAGERVIIYRRVSHQLSEYSSHHLPSTLQVKDKYGSNPPTLQ